MTEIETLQDLVARDGRYKLDAYLFVIEALAFTRQRLKAERHVDGHQLLWGIKELALERFGPLAKMVFESWGVRRTLDFGHIVFNMVDAKLLSKTDDDRIEHFRDGYDFTEVFVTNYTPHIRQLRLN